MERKCINCGTVLARDNTGKLCSPCQKKQLEQKTTYDEEIIDAEGYAAILGLDSAEQLKRLARKGKLAPRIPGITEWKWRKKEIDAWMKQKQEEETQARERAGNREFRRITQILVSNLRRLGNDNYLRGLFPTVGERVYGTEAYLGTNQLMQIDRIQLVRIPRKPAIKILQMLHAKEFPELKGISDWSQLPLDRIHENFLVKLESYF